MATQNPQISKLQQVQNLIGPNVDAQLAYAKRQSAAAHAANAQKAQATVQKQVSVNTPSKVAPPTGAKPTVTSVPSSMVQPPSTTATPPPSSAPPVAPTTPTAPAAPVAPAAPAAPSAYDQAKAAYLATLKPSGEQTDVQAQIDALEAKNAGITAQGDVASADLGGQHIPTPFINAQQQALAKMTAAQTGVQTAQEQPLLQKLARIQAATQQSQTAAKAALDVNTPQLTNIPRGGTLVDQLGKTVAMGQPEPTSGKVVPLYDDTGTRIGSGILQPDGSVTPVQGGTGGNQSTGADVASAAGITTGTALSNPTDEQQAEMMAAGLGAPPNPQSLARSAKTGRYVNEIVNRAAEINPDFSPARAASQYSYASNQANQSAIAVVNAVEPNIDALTKISNDVVRGDWPAINNVMNSISWNTGGKPITNFNELRGVVSDELGKALAGSATLSDAKLSLASTMADPNLSAENFASNMEIVKEALANKKNAIYGQSGQYAYLLDSSLTPPTVNDMGRIAEIKKQHPDASYHDIYQFLSENPDGNSPKADAPAAGAKTGGSVSYRNNNPLNIKFGDFAAGYGAKAGTKATDGGVFATFPDEATGRKAAADLLRSKSYASMSLDSAMRKWSGNGYGAEVAPKSIQGKTIAQMSDDEVNSLIEAMKTREGWKVA